MFGAIAGAATLYDSYKKSKDSGGPGSGMVDSLLAPTGAAAGDYLAGQFSDKVAGIPSAGEEQNKYNREAFPGMSQQELARAGSHGAGAAVEAQRTQRKIAGQQRSTEVRKAQIAAGAQIESAKIAAGVGYARVDVDAFRAWTSYESSGAARMFTNWLRAIGVPDGRVEDFGLDPQQLSSQASKLAQETNTTFWIAAAAIAYLGLRVATRRLAGGVSAAAAKRGESLRDAASKAMRNFRANSGHGARNVGRGVGSASDL